MLKIVNYPDQILIKENQPVNFPLSNDIKTLIKEMWQTVKDKGVGLAAPQVGANYKLCIIHMSEGDKHNANKDFVMINPEIIFYSQAEALMVEGCLSFPGQFYEIWRPQGIRVKFQDEKGRWKEKTLSGWLARVVQHEVDHLNGELFINKGGKKIEEKDLNGDEVVD